MTRTLLIDVYGTLLDLASPLSKHPDRLGNHVDHLADVWRAKQLEYAWVANFTGQYQTFETLTRNALAYALDHLNLASKDLYEDLLADYWQAQAFDDVVSGLEKLSQADVRLVAFSNADPIMLSRALDASGLKHLLDDAWSIHDLGIFKPDRRAYQFASDRLRGAQISFVSSNTWDVAGAARFGWSVYWMNRKAIRFDQTVDIKHVGSFDQLSKAVGVDAL